jgi:hypothetical protein
MLADAELLTEAPLSETLRFSPYSDSSLSDVRLRRVVSFRTRTTAPDPISIPVTGIRRDVRVKIASTADEWEQAFRLVADRYKEKGYAEADAEGMHFTAYHALPDSVTFIAKEQERVVATVSLVPDNVLLGLPMEAVYGEEIAHYRRSGHRLSEITCLADGSLPHREFMPVFMTLCRLMFQYSASQGSNEWVIEVNPRHSRFYKRIWGFVSFGPRRACPAVQGAPAEAFYLNLELMKQNARETFDFVYDRPLPLDAFVHSGIPSHVARRFAAESIRAETKAIDDVLLYLECCEASTAASEGLWRLAGQVA